MNGKKEFGDYQTPLDFSAKVCKLLRDVYAIQPEVVVEPTCGKGNFLESSLIFNARTYLGVELNERYCSESRERFFGKNVEIINADIFGFPLKEKTGDKNVLIIGNPPWVTNSELSTLNSDNLPQKINVKGLRGIEALTGSSNFDICEYIVLQLINEYRNSDAIVAMLCKTSVARNVFKELVGRRLNFKYCDVYEFDSQKVFGINASACLLVVKLCPDASSSDHSNVYSFENGEHISTFGYKDGAFYSDLSNISHSFEGQSCFQWRQGVKHDCAKIMELTLENNRFINGLMETADVEDDLVFPLVKSSMFKSPIIENFSRYVIVTQKKAREDTAYLEREYPKTWSYLQERASYFSKRKSSIYRGAPDFSMFGVGDYSFTKYKVGISGFYKTPLFSLLTSEDGKPVMTDDTSYFICFPTFELAYSAMLFLNSDEVQVFLNSIAFIDAKRPYTKKVLERLDFMKIVKHIRLYELKQTESKLELPRFIDEQKTRNFIQHVKANSGLFATLSD